MARQKLSVEEQRRRNREYQRKRREKINSDQESKHACKGRKYRGRRSELKRKKK